MVNCDSRHASLMVVFAKEITMMPACPLSCPRSRAHFSLASLKPVENRFNTSAFLKEQHPVTAHAPNFDFWTGCREIKRCEESKRTLKNPFASRLTGFNTTLKLLRITDQ